MIGLVDLHKSCRLGKAERGYRGCRKGRTGNRREHAGLVRESPDATVRPERIDKLARIIHDVVDKRLVRHEGSDSGPKRAVRPINGEDEKPAHAAAESAYRGLEQERSGWINRHRRWVVAIGGTAGFERERAIRIDGGGIGAAARNRVGVEEPGRTLLP